MMKRKILHPNNSTPDIGLMRLPIIYMLTDYFKFGDFWQGVVMALYIAGWIYSFYIYIIAEKIELK